jgi:hypothetical protein
MVLDNPMKMARSRAEHAPIPQSGVAHRIAGPGGLHATGRESPRVGIGLPGRRLTTFPGIRRHFAAMSMKEAGTPGRSRLVTPIS